jgi:hypothetical protein
MHRLVLGAHFAMTLLGSCSTRQVCKFFELTGLDRFIASSYGTQQKVAVKIEESIADYDNEEKSRLAKTMTPKEITTCEDETFHPQTCLVAIEPVSNFILLEQYADGRKASDWTQAMEQAVKNMPIKIVQCTSDEGKGIVRHVKKDLGAHHCPDVFHVQHEISKATSAPLSSKTKKAKRDLEKAGEEINRRIQEKQNFANSKPRPGRPPEFDKRIEQARLKEQQASEAFESAEANQNRMKEAIRDISKTYHPVDLETGQIKEAEDVSESLGRCFSEIETSASEANLKESSWKKIKKAKKVVVDMIAAILFFHMTVRAKIEALSLPTEVERALFDNLLPALYIGRVAEKQKCAEDRHRLRLKSKELLFPLQCPNSPLNRLDPKELEVVEKVCEECACLFQPASSCVEGRNGQLSLRHHSLHRLSNRKLTALTAVHNFHIKRRDGTTPASRFFGAKPKDLFEYLLGKVDLPGRPAQKRSKA